MEGQWLNKHEILNDLAEVTGTLDGGRNLTSIRDRPPNKAAELDDESQLFLRMCGAEGDAGGGERRAECEGPDLTSIQRMLQMLYDAEDIPNHNEIEDITSHSTQRLVISKLNPNVDEFIPSKTKTHNEKSPNKKDLTKLNLNNAEAKENSEFNQLVCKDKKVQAFEISNDIEIPKMVDVEKKLRKNVAMSSISAINANTEAIRNMKLLTPDDFCLKPKTENNIENLIAKNLESFRNETHSKIVENDSVNKLKEIEEENDPNVEVSPLDVQESIKKVNNWLEPKVAEPPKPLTPLAPHLGPITYRRKEPLSPKSDSLATLNTPDTSSKSTSSSSPLPYKPYQPSSYAKKLLEKFEMNAAKNAAESEDIWTKLERELKEKDEAIKKALEEGKSPLNVEKTKARGRKR